MEEERALLQEHPIDPDNSGASAAEPQPVAEATVDAAMGRDGSRKEAKHTLKQAKRQIKQLKKQISRRDVCAAKEALVVAVSSRKESRRALIEARAAMAAAESDLQDKREAVSAARKLLQSVQGKGGGSPVGADAWSCHKQADEHAAEREQSSSDSSSSSSDTSSSGSSSSDTSSSSSEEETLVLPPPEGPCDAAPTPPMQEGEVFTLQSVASGRALRIMASGEVNGRGGSGVLARFVVAGRVADRLQLKCARDGDVYLGINPATYQICGTSGDSAFSWFRLVVHADESATVVSLRSDICELPAGVGVLPDGTAKPANETGTGAHGRFVVQRAPQP